MRGGTYVLYRHHTSQISLRKKKLLCGKYDKEDAMVCLFGWLRMSGGAVWQTWGNGLVYEDDGEARIGWGEGKRRSARDDRWG